MHNPLGYPLPAGAESLGGDGCGAKRRWMTTQEASKEGAPAAGPSLTAIFLTFLRLGGTSFGGGTAGWLPRDIVVQRGWVGGAAVFRVVTVGPALPGSNRPHATGLDGPDL